MKLAVSNIAWEAGENAEITPLLHNHDVSGIEIAPTKRWQEPIEATEAEIKEYRDEWLGRGLTPVAMQALLFGKPHLSMFGEGSVETKKYLNKIIRLAGLLSIKTLVFGSPKNRLIENCDRDAAYEEAVSFFRDIGQTAVDNGVIFCIEPNPKEYGCDFITTSLEGLQLVKNVDHPGFGLHLDTGTMLINGEQPDEILPECLPHATHFHISDPNLLIPGTCKSGHSAIASFLQATQYDKWVSIEMKNGQLTSNYEALYQALRYVNNVYFGKNGGVSG
ncbi:hypothetical protein PAECIP111893_00432 [Paenibacillus plantiphilus]|uniref:Xylose isomerase-like TIM barrel domain-containing protein n=1 Tax=Paenibacillus plantiphilus TaxID=2905650 RepID=A0ABM9BS08_9BACL|nr:TIM barrel protein [Paenibacillus plantiphilus]CAH1193315.1 hypothetical protein PAECIP111893_00432 [Paenibacillus plantiphilus]